jgi:hypothetical protein
MAHCLILISIWRSKLVNIFTKIFRICAGRGWFKAEMCRRHGDIPFPVIDVLAFRGIRVFSLLEIAIFILIGNDGDRAVPFEIFVCLRLRASCQFGRESAQGVCTSSEIIFVLISCDHACHS